MLGRAGWILAAVELAAGVVLLGLVGLITPLAQPLAVTAAVMFIAACAMQAIAIHYGRKTSGRHRKAPEAHRAGTGRGSGDGARARRGARGRAGAGVSGRSIPGGPGGLNPNFFARAADEAVLRALMGQRTQIASKAPEAPKSMKRPAGEFDGREREFAAGVVTGTRAFSLDKLGRLRGVAYPAVWTPGENVAKCLVRTDQFAVHLMFGPAGAVTSPSSRTVDAQRPPHSLAECAHGFYGYYEGSNDYYEAGRIMAVVEAYGETVIGTRGFRASKARIVALHIPSDIGVGVRRLVGRNYPEVPLFDSFEAMVAEFPPDDAGHGLGPDSDPDFWTREA